MKKYLFTVLVSIACVSFGQTTNTFPADGNVGIGTLNPIEKLSVRGNVGLETVNGIDGVFSNIFKYGHYGDLESGNSNSNRWHGIDATITAGGAEENKMKFRIYPGTTQNFEPIDVVTLNGAGNVGIGTTNPAFALDISKPGTSTSIHLKKNDGATASWYLHSGRLGAGEFSIGDDNQYRMVFLANGNIGIGTTTPAEKLSVNGKIRAHEIKVETANWPDYVFNKDYQLPTLQETENHIKEKGHLPGIPSATEVKAKGIDLGEMNAKLLQKIEELTLYLISERKRNDEIQGGQQKQLMEQKKLINFLVERLK